MSVQIVAEVAGVAETKPGTDTGENTGNRTRRPVRKHCSWM